MLTGENGILTQAQKAKEETEKAEANEMSDLANIDSLITEYQNNINIPQVTDENPGQLEQEDANTFVINSIEDLAFFSYDVTNETTYEGKTVKLGTNLDFNSDKSYVDPDRTDFAQYGYTGPLKQALTSGTGFSPIGSQDLTNSFYGTFDGDNKAICSLYENINKDDVARAGFFVVTHGEIKNLGLVNVDITAIAQSASVGGIAKTSYNNIYNCYVTGSINVTGSSWTPVGGLCGVMQEEASIENCYNLANINATNIQEEEGRADIGCGGILGQGKANINKCYNKGNIVVDGGNNIVNVGGILGRLISNSDFIKNCYNTGNIEVKSNSATTIGGIIGNIGKGNEIKNCYNIGEIIFNGEVDSASVYIAGIAGYSLGCRVSNVYNEGEIKINQQNSNIRVGGIAAGFFEETISDSYNTGNIIANNTESNNIGSLIGSYNIAIYERCYYLTGTYNVGLGGGETVIGVTGLDRIEDFPSALEVVNEDETFKEDTEGINNGYPILEWQ